MVGRRRRKETRLGQLPLRDRLRLRHALWRASVKGWWQTPGATFQRPPRDPARFLEGVREHEAVESALRSFADLAFPLIGDAEALVVECEDHRARRWAQSFFDNKRRRAFAHADSVLRFLRWVADDLMCGPVAVRRIDWQPDGSFRLLHLLPRGVEPLPGGSYRVYPPEAHSWYQEQHPAEPYDLSERSILIFEGLGVLGDGVPLIRTLPQVFDGLLDDRRPVTSLEAATFTEDRSIRAQVARLRQNSLSSIAALPNSRVTRGLHGSLLRLQSMTDMVAEMLGGKSDRYAPVTEHYLAWQHREALRVARAVREDLVAALGERLLLRSASRAGFAVTGFRLRTRGAPSQDEIDAAFDDFVAGRLDLRHYHDRILWPPGA